MTAFQINDFKNLFGTFQWVAKMTYFRYQTSNLRNGKNTMSMDWTPFIGAMNGVQSMDIVFLPLC